VDIKILVMDVKIVLNVFIHLHNLNLFMLILVMNKIMPIKK